MSENAEPSTVVIPAEAIEKLRARARFKDDADIHAFIADALNTYTDLGTLHGRGGRLMWHPDDGTAPRRLRLPFDDTPDPEEMT